VATFFAYILKWWFFSVIIGIIAFPISFALFKKSYEKGFMFSKIIGLFLLSYFSWLLGFIYFSIGTIYTVLFIMIVISTFIYMGNKDEIKNFLSNNPGIIIISELFYLFVFILYAVFRMYQPDIVGTEKFMDFAFMNSIANADKMPPYDPWMYGVSANSKPLYISYYYFGYFMMAVMMKLVGIPNGSAYNLALTYIVSLTSLGMLGLLFNLTKNYLIGFLGVAFLLLISNLDGFIQVVQHNFSFDGFNWWHSSRIIDYKDYDVTINEFPFFSFLLGDMHPHQMALPFVLLALNIALSFIKTDEKNLFEKNFSKISFLVFSGLVLGGLWFLNSWDFPTYFFIVALCILSYKYASNEKIKDWVNDAIYALVIIFIVAIVAYLPFTLGFQSQAKGIGPTKANTKITDYFIIYGIMLFPILSFILFRILNWLYALRLQGVAGTKLKNRPFYCPRCGAEIREGKKICGQCGYMISGDELLLGGLELPAKKSNQTVLSIFKFFLEPDKVKDGNVYFIFGVVIAIAVILIIFKSAIDKPNFGLFSGLMVFLISSTLLLGLTKIEFKENQFIIILIFIGFLVSLGCELLHIIDTFSREGQHAPLERMNTVFKFYFQTWIFYSVAAAYSYFWVSHFYLKFKPIYIRYAWMLVFVALVGMGLFYPLAATTVKTGGLKGYMTLDGTEFLKYRAYEGRMPAEGDYKAIEWIKKNIKGKEVILEAWGNEYTEYARITSFTGLPTVIGWPGHELQWRGTWDEAGRRSADVDKIYETLNIEEAKSLLKKYNVKYVYVGVLEKDKYIGTLARDKDLSKEFMEQYNAKKQALEKFSQFMDIVYADSDLVTIYKMRD
jgi:YYY domain-containing protein